MSYHLHFACLPSDIHTGWWRRWCWSQRLEGQWLQVENFFFLAFHGFIDRSVEDMTGKRGRERGSDTQQRDPGRELNPSTLQSLGTWDALYQMN